jgi:hypothetical protein
MDYAMAVSLLAQYGEDKIMWKSPKGRVVFILPLKDFIHGKHEQIHETPKKEEPKQQQLFNL